MGLLICTLIQSIIIPFFFFFCKYCRIKKWHTASKRYAIILFPTGSHRLCGNGGIRADRLDLKSVLANHTADLGIRLLRVVVKLLSCHVISDPGQFSAKIAFRSVLHAGRIPYLRRNTLESMRGNGRNCAFKNYIFQFITAGEETVI